MLFLSPFFARSFVKVQVVEPYCSIDKVTAWKDFGVILWERERSDFQMVVNLSVHVNVYLCMI